MRREVRMSLLVLENPRRKVRCNLEYPTLAVLRQKQGKERSTQIIPVRPWCDGPQRESRPPGLCIFCISSNHRHVRKSFDARSRYIAGSPHPGFPLMGSYRWRLLELLRQDSQRILCLGTVQCRKAREVQNVPSKILAVLAQLELEAGSEIRHDTRRVLLVEFVLLVDDDPDAPSAMLVKEEVDIAVQGQKGVLNARVVGVMYEEQT